MATTATLSPPSAQSRLVMNWFMLLLLGVGLLLRLRLAWTTYLNPDEALHYFLSHQPSLGLAYQASLTTAHPPLMVLFLYYWTRLGTSEFCLRLPFVIAGTLFCWVMFLWVERVANRNAAWFTFVLFLFVPSLISLSAEIRQYSLLLLFCAVCLYSLQRAFEENSAKWMAGATGALYLALLTHYSALIFAAAVVSYALLLLIRAGIHTRVTTLWVLGQIGAAALCIFLFRSHISRLRISGLPSEIADTWLRSSIFHRGQDHFAVFAWTRTLRLFRYFFSHGTIGIFGLVLFVLAICLLLQPASRRSRKVEDQNLGFLLILPFLITLATALAGVYPYGGTRHDVVLAIFGIPGVAIGLARLPFGRLAISAQWFKPLPLAIALIICNLFPSPSGPYIRPANQNRRLMEQAMSFLRSLPANSVLFTDAQGSLVLNYYFCTGAAPVPFVPSAGLLKLRCGHDYVLVSQNEQEGFDRVTFPTLLKNAWESVPWQDTLYTFQTGWIDDKEQDWINELRTLGGDPRNFGPNILACRIPKSKLP